MVNIDKLLKSFENLRVFHSGINSDETLVSINKSKPKDSGISKKDKIFNCNVIAESISSSQLRSSPEFPKFLSLSIELFLSLCDDVEPDVRIVADECLNKVIKSLLDSNVSRLQVELYKEIKKNDASRSLRAALMKFADLCHLIRPQKCRPYVVNLLPCLMKISQRNDEGIQECLASSMLKICSVLMSFATELETKMLMKSFLSNVKSHSAITRRTAAISLTMICLHSRKPHNFFLWLLNYLIDHLSSSDRVTDTRTLHGLLIILRQLLLHFSELTKKEESSHCHHANLNCQSNVFSCNATPSCHQLLKVGVFVSFIELYNRLVLQIILQYSSHVDHNITNASLECLLQFFKNVHYQFMNLLLVPGSLKNFLTEEMYLQPLLIESDNVLNENLKNPGLTSESFALKAESIGDLSQISDMTPTAVGNCNNLVLDSGSQKTQNALTDQENEFLIENFKDVDADDSFIDVSSAIQTVPDVDGISGDIGNLSDDKESPIIYLVRFLCSKFLLSGSKGSLIPDRQVKVSIKVLAVHCLTSLVHLHPKSLRITLHRNVDETSSEIEHQYVEDVLAYASHSDPQLKGNIALLIGSYLSTKVSCKCTHESQKDIPIKSEVCEVEKLLALLMELYDGESSVAARCSLRAFQVSLPVLLEGNHADSALNVLLMLLKLKNNCYWLIKVELLQLLSILNLQTLFYLEKLVEQKKSYTYIKNLDIQDLITDVIIGLLGDEDARVRQAAIRAICKIIPQLYYPSDNLHSCSLTSKAVGMVTSYLPGRTSDNGDGSRPTFPFYDFQSKPCNVEVSHQMESSLSRVVNRIMKSLNQSTNKNFTLGCCSALRQLSEEYPVHKFVGAWLSLFKHPTSPTTQSNSFMSRILSRSKSNNGIASTTLPMGHNIGNEDWSTTLVGGPLSFILSTLTSSPMSQDGYFHSDALRFAGNLFVGTAVHNFNMSVESESSQTWCSLSDKYLALLGDRLFVHTMRVLNIYFHIIEDVPASAFQTKTLPTTPSLSPIKRKTKITAGKEESSQIRTPSSNQDKSLGSGRDPPKDGLGTFINIQHYVQLSAVLKSAYTAFKISSDIFSDKFLLLLRSALIVLSQQLELATLNEVSRCADEILIYLSSTFTLDPSASLLCVKQLLKSIFGTNMASSQDASSIITNQQLHASRHGSTLQDCSSLYNACFKLPSFFFLNGEQLDGLRTVQKSSSVKKLSEKLSTISLNKLFSKAEKSSVATYIKLFEPLVIKALKQYTLTSLVNVQLQVLDLLTTLVQLRVNYCLLDSDQIFIGFVLKQVEMIETGQIKAPERLLPQIFNFLIYLSFEKYHNKSIITMPKVIQLCDGIMASELDQLCFTIPCLKHIVANLFGTNPDSKSDPKELETQREVVVSMLLKLLKYCEILDMVCLVLKNSKTEGDDKHNKLSRQISDHIFPMLVKQEVLIENSKDFQSVLHLIECMSPCVFRPVDILINVLFSIPSDLTEVNSLCSWMVQVLCCLKVFMTISEEDVILFKVKQSTLSPPLFLFGNCSFFSANEEDSGETILTKFILHALEVMAFQINNFSVANIPKEKKNFLCQEMFQLLLLIENMISHHSHVLEAMKIAVLSEVPGSQTTYWSKLTNYFWEVHLEHPIISIHWCMLSLKLVSSEMFLNWWSQLFHCSTNLSSTSANKELIRKTGFILLCQHVSEKADANILEWLISNNLQDIIQMIHEESVNKLISIIHEKETTSRFFCNQIKIFFSTTNKFQLSFIRSSLKSIESAHSSQAGFVLSLLTTCFLPTSHPSISRIVDKMMCHNAEILLATPSEQCEEKISHKDALEVMKHIELHSMKQSHLMSLMLKLVSHLSKDHLSPTNHEDHLSTVQFDKKDFVKLVQNACFNASYDFHESSLLLLSLDYSFVSSILMSEECNPCLLKSCIQLSSSQLQSIQALSKYNLPNLSRNESHVSSLTQMFKAASFALLRNINKIVNILPSPYKFFEYERDFDGSTEKIVNSFRNIKSNQLLVTFAECLEAYLDVFVSCSSSILLDMKVDISDVTVKDICRFCIFFLESTHRDMKKNKKVSISKLLLCLSCMNLALSNPQFHLHFSSPDNFLFICSSVHIVHSLLSSFVARQSGVLVKHSVHNKEECFLIKSDEHDLTIRTCDLMSELVFALSTHLSTSQSKVEKYSDIPPQLKISFRKLIIELARMPLVNSYARTPTVVWNMGWAPTPTGQNKTKLPPIPLEFLQEKDVLSEFVFRVNSIGWTNRQQFEETWMSLLAVLNPVQHSAHQLSQEELLERTHCQILSIRSITSLLLSCTLSPHPGNPSSSFFDLKPRNKFQEYFATSNGQKLLKVKTKLEMELWKIMSDNYRRLHQYNMIPLMNNNEREIGDFSYHPGQFSSHFIMSMINTLENNYNISNVQQTTDVLTTTNENVSDPLNQKQNSLDTVELDPGNTMIPPMEESQEAVYLTSLSSSVVVSHDIDVHSCVQFLLELYGSFLCPSSKTPLHLINETVRSILLLSDIFTDQSQYEWMLITMLDLTKSHPHEDELLGCYIILATCKAATIVGLDPILTEKIAKLIEWNLRSTHLPTKISTLYGGLYILEASQYEVARAVIPHYVDYLLRSLSSFTPSTIHSQQHALVMWSLSFYVMENYYQDVKDMEFPTKFFQMCMSMMTSYQDSTPLPIYVSIMTGLERLAVSGSIEILDLDALIKFSTDRFCQQNTQRSLIAFNLMVTCMYIDLLKTNMSNEDSKESDTDASMKVMERVTVIFDRTRKGMPHEAAIIMKVLPTLLMDFFEGHEIMNKIIGEFLNNQQPQTQLFAQLLFQIFDHLMQADQSQLVINWVMLSLSNFTQRTPISMAVWSLTCVFICSSTNPWLRSIYPMVLNRAGVMEAVDCDLFCASAIDFYKNLLINKSGHSESFLEIFSSVASYNDSPYQRMISHIKSLKL